MLDQPNYNQGKDLEDMECHDKALSLIPVAQSNKGDDRDEAIEGDNMEV